jgi:hypothetical protein
MERLCKSKEDAGLLSLFWAQQRENWELRAAARVDEERAARYAQQLQMKDQQLQMKDQELQTKDLMMRTQRLEQKLKQANVDLMRSRGLLTMRGLIGKCIRGFVGQNGSDIADQSYEAKSVLQEKRSTR